jgi:hypothetical protein
MPVHDVPSPGVEIVAILSSKASRCEIVRRASDAEDGDPIEARCGDRVKIIAKALKGLSSDRLSACHVLLTINAVHSPSLFDISTCKGGLQVKDLGKTWVARLQKRMANPPKNLEFVSYEKLPRRPGCYSVTITYDVEPGSGSTPFRSRSGTFCVGP